MEQVINGVTYEVVFPEEIVGDKEFPVNGNVVTTDFRDCKVIVYKDFLEVKQGGTTLSIDLDSVLLVSPEGTFSTMSADEAFRSYDCSDDPDDGLPSCTSG